MEEWGMFAIRAGKLSMSDAEDVLAKIWCGLEMYGIQTPRLVVNPAPNDIIDLRICFRYAEDADLMLRTLKPSAAHFRREAPDLRLVDVA